MKGILEADSIWQEHNLKTGALETLQSDAPFCRFHQQVNISTSALKCCSIARLFPLL